MTTNRPKISVIVPVYNAGSHLKKCLDTLLGQSLKELEIILVLDCPTDGSDIIAKQYASSDQRIVLIENRQNKHIGLTRNEGLKVARGEYIGFSDHDDFREPTMYEELYKKAKEEEADLVLSLPGEILNGEKKISDCKEFSEKPSKKMLLSDLIGFGNNEHPEGACFVNIHNNIYRSDLIKEHRIQFVDTKNCSPEDVIFQIQSIFFSKKTVLLRKAFYFHQNDINNEGLQYSYVGYEKRPEGLRSIYNFLIKNNIFEEYKSSFYNGVCRQFINCLAAATLKGNYLTVRKKLRSYEFCSNAFNNYALEQRNNGLANRLFRKFLVLSLK
jgi:glycosyltransferase involved in cell wall biosynthesis